MRLILALCILLAAGIVAAAILFTERFQVWHRDATFYVIHDTWTGRIDACTIEGFRPEVVLICDRVERRAGQVREPMQE